MKNRIKLIAVTDLAFILLLSLAGILDGWPWQVARAAVFLLLISPALILAKRFDEREERPMGRLPLGIKGGNLLLTIPTLAPSVLLIFGVSALTSLILTSFGASGSTVEDAPIWEMILIHALIPAVLEEGLFRLVPLRLLGADRPGLCVILSALFFAFVHCSFYSIPYALVAGIIFMALDIAFDSVLPSLILHLINNTMSVLWIKYCNTPTRVTIYLAILGGAAVISAVVMILLRGKYKLAFARIFEKKEKTADTTSDWLMPSVILLGICTVLATVNIFTGG